MRHKLLSTYDGLLPGGFFYLNENLASHAKDLKSLKDMMLKEINQSTKAVWCRLYDNVEKAKKKKSVEIQNRSPAARTSEQVGG